MAMVMPLGVLANQLVKMEADLRFLSMKAAEHAGDEDVRPTKAVDARLDLIHDALESIKALLSTLQADLHPKEPAPKLITQEQHNFSAHKSASDLDD